MGLAERGPGQTMLAESHLCVSHQVGAAARPAAPVAWSRKPRRRQIATRGGLWSSSPGRGLRYVARLSDDVGEGAVIGAEALVVAARVIGGARVRVSA